MALQDDIQELSEVVRDLIREMKAERKNSDLLKCENNLLRDRIRLLEESVARAAFEKSMSRL